MNRLIQSPGKYIQGPGAIKHLQEYTKDFGKTFLVLATDTGLGRIKGSIEESFKGTDSTVYYEVFNRECSQKEIDRICKIILDKKCECVIAVGGGKTADTGKAAAYYSKTNVVVVPTIASTDAPCSALSVVYQEDGVFESYLVLPQNPSIVVMDEDIIAQSPVRLLVSGMGDALATFVEAKAARQAGALNMAGFHPANAAYELARLCYNTIITEGYKAMMASKNQVKTAAVADIIEANTYLSGIGFESGCLAGAHAIHNGLTVIHELHDMQHGEKVAFGTLTELILENAPEEDIQEVLAFCTSVGLPVCFADMGYPNYDKKKVMEAAIASCAEGESIHNEPFEVTPADVYAAMITADAIGTAYKEA
ncbi:MAG: glycerol dehydrogenase [Peptostreptococcaceae bacterium]|nr:glycerol dehydrogenase [Peptostreptococcaceae bacterium]